MATLIVQHHAIGRAGRLGASLRDHSHLLRIVQVDRGEALPGDLDDVDAVVSLGGCQNVDDPREKNPWMTREIELLREAHERQLPVIGVCLGAQLIATALGGEVQPLEAPEIGLVEVELKPAGQTDVALAGVAWKHAQFCHHGQEIVKLPAGAIALASSARCAVQAFRAGLRTYAFQFHFEADEAMIRALVASSLDDLSRAGVLPEDIDKQIEGSYAQFDRMAWRLSENLAELVAPVRWRTVGA